MGNNTTHTMTLGSAKGKRKRFGNMKARARAEKLDKASPRQINILQNLNAMMKKRKKKARVRNAMAKASRKVNR